MIKKIRAAIISDNLIQKGDKIIIGFSGGPDSTCLVHALFNLKDELGFEICCVHINHMIRGVDADLDEAFTKMFCAKLGIELDCYKYDIPSIICEKRLSSEEAGRYARYEAFEISKAKYGANKIALAHNKNDQAETLLMRLLRGTSPTGLACMEPIRDGIFIRPILGIERDEILLYCLENNLNPRIDLSNLESIYTRNKIRLELIPYLEKNYSENLISSLYRLSKIAAEDKGYFKMLIQELADEHVKFSFVADTSNSTSNATCDDASSDTSKATWDDDSNDTSSETWNDASQLLEIMVPNSEAISTLHALDSQIVESLNQKPNRAELANSVMDAKHPAIRKRLMLHIISEIGYAENVSSVNLEAAVKFLETGITSKTFEFPNSIVMETSYGQIIFKSTHSNINHKSANKSSIKGNRSAKSLETIMDQSEISHNLHKLEGYEFFKMGKLNKNIIEPKEILNLKGSDNIKYFDYDKISKSKATLMLRTRRAGDYIIPFGMKGTKKLKEFFIDEKISKAKRDTNPLVCLGSEVVWIIGSRINEEYKITNETARVLMLEYIQEQ